MSWREDGRPVGTELRRPAQWPSAPSQARGGRTVALSNPRDPLSLVSQTDTVITNGRASTTTYDAATRTFTTTSAAGRQIVTTVDAQGRPLQTQASGMLPVVRTYDTHGRLATITQGARSTSFSYNPEGFLGSITDALSRTIGFQYDLAGRVTQQTLPDTRVIAFTYDANGNVTSITPPGRPSHGFDYTPVDLESEYLPPQPQPPVSSPQTLYQYNLDRQLDLITRPDGQTIDLVYDTAGRLSQQLLPAGQGQIGYTYDPSTGNLATITGPNGEALSFTYDGSLLLSESWTGPVAGTVSRTYDNDPSTMLGTGFRVATQGVNGSNTASFSYDSDSLLTSAGATTLSRDSQNGLLTGTSMGNVSDGYTYSGFGEVASYAASFSATPLYSVAYTRNSLGRIAQKTETVSGVTTTFEYGYDVAGRLIDVATNSTPTAHYDYDATGNRIGGFTLSGAITGAQYDNQDRLLSLDLGPWTLDYSYAANGELQSKTITPQPPASSLQTLYQYDALGNLRKVTLPDATVIDYVVDGRGRRAGASTIALSTVARARRLDTILFTSGIVGTALLAVLDLRVWLGVIVLIEVGALFAMIVGAFRISLFLVDSSSDDFVRSLLPHRMS